jgi:hypothetical protein
MPLGRIIQSTSLTATTPSNTATPLSETPVLSATTTALRVNLGLALKTIPSPIPPLPGPAVRSLVSLEFQPDKITLSRYVGVVGTNSAGTKVGGSVADARTKADILNRAQMAGLDRDELNRLKQILDSSPDVKADASLLKQILPDYMNDPFAANADRALRSFMDLDELRRAHPDRITPDVVKSLVMGVAHSKSLARVDEFEGVLGEDAVRRAAHALIVMPEVDYKAIQGALAQAGHGGDIDSDPETERALILKAVSARAEEYGHPTINDSVVRPQTLEIETFANTIRGKNRDDLIARTTVVAGNDVLEQRYMDSCSAATVQMAKAEADPIYAWFLHNEEVHSRDLGGFIGRQQAELMKEVGGVPVSFQTLEQLEQIMKMGGPLAAIAKSMHDALEKQGSNVETLANLFVSDTTGRNYHSYKVNNDNSSRTAAADYIEKLVRQGVDVPIGVNWTSRKPLNPLQTADNGLSHALLITDVRGHGDNTVFVVADPGGATFEISRSDLIAGQNFGGALGRLSEFLF